MNHQVVSYDVEPPSNLEMFVGMITKTADEQKTGWLQSISIRMPINLACTIDALAQYSGHSRNKLIVKALEAAVDQMFEQIPGTEREEIEMIRAEILGKRIAEWEAGAKTESGEV